MVFSAGAAHAGRDGFAKMITDVAGRQVEVPQEAKRIILGEGRQMYLLAAFDTDAPFNG